MRGYGLWLGQPRRAIMVCIPAAAVMLIAAVGAAAAELPPLEGRDNLAAGRPVVFAPVPNYRLTQKGESDAADLTDGKLTRREDRHIWFDAGAVGWSYGGRVNLAVDLGRPAEIDEIAIRLLGGSPQAGITFPGWIEAFVSDDGQHYRKVAECSRWRKGDFERFAVPDDAGKGWIHCLRFGDLKVRGRWVGLRMYTGGLGASDELYVFGSAAKPQQQASGGGEPADFTVLHPQPYFHKPQLVVATNAAAPLPVGLVVPPEPQSREPLEMLMEVPAGVELMGGRFGQTELGESKPRTTAQGAKQYRLTVSAGKSTKVLGRLYVQAPGWRNAQTGKLLYRFKQADWQSPMCELPIVAREVPPAPRLERIMVGLGWWSAADTARWPNALDAWERLGLNSFPLFAHWTKPKDPLWKLVEQARERGLFIVNIDSPLHRMLERARGKPEIHHQFADGSTSKKLCPSYRGRFYREEVERFAKAMGRARPHFASLDIELWGWQGPIESHKCTRCRKDFEASGLDSWEQWQLAKGDQMWRDLIAAARTEVAKAGGGRFEIGGYDFRPGGGYQNVWSVDRLYPDHMQSSQVSTYTCLYPYHLELIGDEVRKDRKLLPKSDVLPWLTPGDAGTFPGESFQWALLECYCNGARGIYFWSGRVWDAESLIAYNRVVRAIAPVEDLIVRGELVGTAATVERPGRLSGIRHSRQMLLLAADYFGRSKGSLKLRLKLAARSEIRDLLTREVLVAEIAPGEHLVRVPLADARARLLHVCPLD